MSKLSYKMALSGILSAVCVVLMFFVGFLPIFVYVFPMLCGYIMYAIYFECGTKMALSSYASVAILSLLLGPDKEAGLLYLTFFGYYPIAKVYIDKLNFKLLRLIIKLAIFNAAVIGTYWILINILDVVSIEDFVGDGAKALIWAFLGLCNIVFLLYDFAQKRVSMVYELYLRKLILKRK